MNEEDKEHFYDFHSRCIHPVIKSEPATKPLWRRLFWTTKRNSIEYKCGCVDILENYFPFLFNELERIYLEEIKLMRKN